MAAPRRPRAATAEKRERLLDATEEIMLEDGYAAVSSRSVANRVGINAPLVHYYFPTIDDLFIAVLRRRADARWRISADDVLELAALQRELLASAAALVRPGGRLVYSVCTLTSGETTAIDEWARDALADFRALEPPGSPWQPRGRGAWLLPHRAGTDGMYVLVLERSSG